MIHTTFEPYEVSLQVFTDALTEELSSYEIPKGWITTFCAVCQELFDSPLNKSGGFVIIDGQPLCVFDDYFSDDSCVLTPAICNLGVYDHQTLTDNYSNIQSKFNLERIDTVFPVIDLSAWKQQEITEKVIRDFMKSEVKNNFIPHHFGTKSQKVKWRVVFGETSNEREYLIKLFAHDTAALVEQQMQSILTKTDNGIERFFAERMPEFWFAPHDFMSPSMGAVVAYDEHKVICAMQLQKYDSILTCGSIAFDHTDVYKPYSLASMAHLESIIYAMGDPLINRIDLGVNFSPLGDYKKVFNYTNVGCPTYLFKR